MAVPQNYLSFSEIIQGRPALVRLSHDGLLSAVDLVKVMTGQDNSASNQDLNRLKPAAFSADHFVIRARHKWVAPEHALKLAQVVKPAVNPEIRGPIKDIIKGLIQEAPAPAAAEPGIGAAEPGIGAAEPGIASAEPCMQADPPVSNEAAGEAVSGQSQQELPSVEYGYDLAMPFEEMAPGEKVRFVYINQVPYLSVKDLIKVICNPTAKNAMCPWNQLSENQKTELLVFCKQFTFPGRGYQDSKVITFKGALSLVMCLGGERATEFRSKMVTILTRYFAGDPTIVRDLYANAQSDSPINQFARASLQSESGDGLEPASKRQRIDPYTEEELVRFERFDKVASRFEHHNVHFREHVSLVKEELEAYVWKESEMVRLAAQREQDAIKAARERAELEASVEKDRLKFRQANYNLGLLEAQSARDSRKDELLHSQATKHVQTQPLQPTAQDEGGVMGPAGTTTVLKVYHAHKSAFAMLPREQTRAFLVKAGHLAKQAYVAQFGLQPERAMEQGFHVNVYPSFAEPLILTALRGALRDITAGGNQPPLRFSVVVPGIY